MNGQSTAKSIPILTRILHEEKARIATPDIGERAWLNIARELGLGGGAKDAASSDTTSGIIDINTSRLAPRNSYKNAPKT